MTRRARAAQRVRCAVARHARPSPATRLLLFAAALCAGAACGDSGPRTADTSAVDREQQPSAATATGAGPIDTCPKSGLWRRCSLEDRLESAGFVVDSAPDTLRHEWLSVEGLRYDFAQGVLDVFVYPSADAARQDASKLDSARAAPAGVTPGYRWPPTMIVSRNVLAVMQTANDRFGERLLNAVAAGLPESAP